MSKIGLNAAILALSSGAVLAQSSEPIDPSAAFGARPSVIDLSLSPDGNKVAYIAPTEGQGSALYTLGLESGAKPKAALGADGKPFRLGRCNWVSNDRLVCRTYAVIKDPTLGLTPVSRILAINADGTDGKLLSTRQNEFSRGYQLFGGDVIDWLPDEDAAVLMTRQYLPDDHTGSQIGSTEEGLGVDRIDTRTLAAKHVESPRRGAIDYISDGRGTVRIVLDAEKKLGEQTGLVLCWYRVPGSRQWLKLGSYDDRDGSGFLPVAVDHDRNVAYGFKKKDGRVALYTVTLDEAKRENLAYARDDVDIDELIFIGRRSRVVGASYALSKRQSEYIDPEIAKIVGALSKAMPPGSKVAITDSSVDERKMLVFSESDVNSGLYHIFDRNNHHLDAFMIARTKLAGMPLATVKPVSFPADDGVSIPGYLTFPPGREDAKGLPAIVMPHGGPSARDEWGFDWLAQFYAARGFAVLQPNFRGSSGYGDQWFQKNGFRSWPVAIGDVLSGGRWLVQSGVADPSKLAAVGWSYGGYAALQSAVVDSTLFKAVVAIAPVTDLTELKDDHRDWSDFGLVSEFVGDGPHMHEGSPIEHVDKIRAPIMLFHGELDRNVSIKQSKHFCSRLAAVGGKCELVSWSGLDHQIDDSAARAQMLSKSDAFLRHSLNIAQ